MDWANQSPYFYAFATLVVLILGYCFWFAVGKGAPHYTSAGVLLSAAELNFFRCLQEAMPANCYVACKVRLADILMVGQQVKQKHQPKAFNRIKSKHADFVICDSSTFRILGVVELDDRSHQRADRRARDIFFDESMKSAGLPVLRVKARREYDSNELRDWVKTTCGTRRSRELHRVI